MFTSTILLVPGLGNSGPQHWQTYWAKRYQFPRVNQQDWDSPDCRDWMAMLDKTVAAYNPAEVILVGHSLACATITKWVEQYSRTVKAAMLVAPADTEAPGFPTVATGFSPMAIQKLPFPSLVVASSNDAYVSLERARYFADCWGSSFVNIGAAGHINAATDLKDWPAGLQLLRRLD
jgi:predicted alpha/beta hydrolase family esterase